MDEIEELVPLYHSLAYTDLEKEDIDWADVESTGAQTRRLYRGLFPSGFGRFSPVEYTPLNKMSGDEYPLTLLSGSILYHFGGGTRSLRSWRLKKFSPRSWIEISEADARQLGFGDGEPARVVAPVGEAAASIKITDSLPSGVLFMPMSFPESQVNELFGTDLDSQAKTPSLKSCSVRLERTGDNG